MFIGVKKKKKKKKKTEQKLSFLHATLLLYLIYVPTQNDQVISNSLGVMACIFRHHNGESESTLKHGIRILVLINATAKYYQNISNHYEVTECIRI